MESRGNGNTVLLTVVGVATLLVALVGATFAYFSATVGNDDAQSISVQTANPTSLTYDGTTGISLLNAQPGDSKSATFTITNPSSNTNSQSYNLKLVVDGDTFTTTHEAVSTDSGDQGAGTTTNQLVLTVTNEAVNSQNKWCTNGASCNGSTGATIDLTNGSAIQTTRDIDIIKGVVIGIDGTNGVVQTYTTKIEFVETNSNQDENKDKSFSGHIEVYDAKPISTNPGA